jgi:hypothetical protein
MHERPESNFKYLPLTNPENRVYYFPSLPYNS